MSKTESPWFKHDYNARTDPKMIRLRRVKGMKGVGIYWTLIEILHEQGGMIKMDEIPDIAFELREDETNVLSVINDFDLFVIRSYEIRNTRVDSSLLNRKEKSQKAKDSIKNRWKNKKPKTPDNKESDTNVLQNENDRNTIRVDKSRVDKNNSIVEGDNTSLETFDVFRKLFPGIKKGNGTEFQNFKKKHKDWRTILPILRESVSKQIAIRDQKKQRGDFVPEWKNLQTWINGRCWEEEMTLIPGTGTGAVHGMEKKYAESPFNVD
jgi:hypothetical protein